MLTEYHGSFEGALQSVKAERNLQRKFLAGVWEHAREITIELDKYQRIGFAPSERIDFKEELRIARNACFMLALLFQRENRLPGIFDPLSIKILLKGAGRASQPEPEPAAASEPEPELNSTLRPELDAPSGKNYFVSLDEAGTNFLTGLQASIEAEKQRLPDYFKEKLQKHLAEHGAHADIVSEINVVVDYLFSDDQLRQGRLILLKRYLILTMDKPPAELDKFFSLIKGSLGLKESSGVVGKNDSQNAKDKELRPESQPELEPELEPESELEAQPEPELESEVIAKEAIQTILTKVFSTLDIKSLDIKSFNQIIDETYTSFERLAFVEKGIKSLLGQRGVISADKRVDFIFRWIEEKASFFSGALNEKIQSLLGELPQEKLDQTDIAAFKSFEKFYRLSHSDQMSDQNESIIGFFADPWYVSWLSKQDEPLEEATLLLENMTSSAIDGSRQFFLIREFKVNKKRDNKLFARLNEEGTNPDEREDLIKSLAMYASTYWPGYLEEIKSLGGDFVKEVGDYLEEFEGKRVSAGVQNKEKKRGEKSQEKIINLREKLAKTKGVILGIGSDASAGRHVSAPPEPELVLPAGLGGFRGRHKSLELQLTELSGQAQRKDALEMEQGLKSLESEVLELEREVDAFSRDKITEQLDRSKRQVRALENTLAEISKNAEALQKISNEKSAELKKGYQEKLCQLSEEMEAAKDVLTRITESLESKKDELKKNELETILIEVLEFKGKHEEQSGQLVRLEEKGSVSFSDIRELEKLLEGVCTLKKNLCGYDSSIELFLKIKEMSARARIVLQEQKAQYYRRQLRPEPEPEPELELEPEFGFGSIEGGVADSSRRIISAEEILEGNKKEKASIKDSRLQALAEACLESLSTTISKQKKAQKTEIKKILDVLSSNLIHSKSGVFAGIANAAVAKFDVKMSSVREKIQKEFETINKGKDTSESLSDENKIIALLYCLYQLNEGWDRMQRDVFKILNQFFSTDNLRTLRTAIGYFLNGTTLLGIAGHNFSQPQVCMFRDVWEKFSSDYEYSHKTAMSSGEAGSVNSLFLVKGNHFDFAENRTGGQPGSPTDGAAALDDGVNLSRGMR